MGTTQDDDGHATAKSDKSNTTSLPLAACLAIILGRDERHALDHCISHVLPDFDLHRSTLFVMSVFDIAHGDVVAQCR